MMNRKELVIGMLDAISMNASIVNIINNILTEGGGNEKL